MMCGRWAEERYLDAGVAVLLDPAFNFVRRPARGHSLDIRIRDSLDQGFHTAFGVSRLELGDVLLSNVGLSDAHLWARDKRDLDRVEFCRHLPSDRVKRCPVVIFHGAIEDLRHFAFGEVASRFVGSRLYGVDATDPVAFAAAAVALLVIGAGASLVPARRASQTDPIIVLRVD